MAVSSNGTTLIFNDGSTQQFGFTGAVAAANITGTITAPQIAPGVIPSGGVSGAANVYTSPNPGFTIPPTTTRLKVTVVGGGGNGGPVSIPPCGGGGSGGGGGGGGASVRWITAPFGQNPVPITVGGASGTSSFGSYASATGGSSVPTNSPGGGAAGTGSSGTINFTGQGGQNSGGFQTPVIGGSSLMGLGGHPSQKDGRGYGGAGGGTVTVQTESQAFSTPGGTGSPGIIIVEY
jgi:hypothetical protein